MSREVEYRPDIKLDDDERQVKKDGVHLDSNHTHFILVDDGSNDEYGAEINFRAELENELQLGRSMSYYEQFNTNSHSIDLTGGNIDEKIPMILIVVQGGPRTLQTVYESINKCVPVLVLAVSFKIYYNFRF
jgi:hypothetical protein